MQNLRKIVFLTVLVIFTVTNCSFFGSSPEKTIDELVKAAKVKDWGKAYDCFSKESMNMLEKIFKGNMEVAYDLMIKTNPEAAHTPQMQITGELIKLTGRDFFIKLLNTDTDSSNKMVGEYENYQVISKEINNDKAKLKIKTPIKASDDVYFIKVEGKWKIDLSSKFKQSHIQGQQ